MAETPRVDPEEKGGAVSKTDSGHTVQVLQQASSVLISAITEVCMILIYTSATEHRKSLIQHCHYIARVITD